jgi:mono/diheme cytochrome c family protein
VPESDIWHLISAAAVFFAMLMPAIAAAEGNAVRGREKAITYCARCHVVGDHNPMGGIGSTPSFQLLVKRRPDFEDRFRTFYARRPHPVYVRVPGVPKWSDAQPYATPFTVTLDEIEDILAFAKTLKK